MLFTFFSDTSIFSKFIPYLDIQSFGRLSSLNKYFYQFSSQFQKELKIEIQHYLQDFSFEQRMEKLLDKKMRHLSIQDILELKTLIDCVEDLGEDLPPILSPLLIKVCSFTNSYVMAKLLLENGADPKAANSKGFTALHYAALANQENVCKLLVEAGAPVNAQTIAGATPLHLAAIRSNQERNVQKVFCFLFSHPNTNLDLCDKQRKKASDYYFRHFQDLPGELQEQILTHVQTSDWKGIKNLSLTCTVFRQFYYRKRWEELQQKYPGDSPFLIFLKVYNALSEPTIRELSEILRDVRRDLLAILHCATLDVTQLCNERAETESDTHAEPFLRLTLLHLVAKYEFLLPVAKLLIKKGALVDAQEFEGFTPLFEAFKNGCRGICELLVKHGANVNAINVHHTSLLMWGIMINPNIAIDLCQFLIEKGADVHFVLPQSGSTPLHAAHSHLALSRLLIAHGANVNAVNLRNATPIHYATAFNQFEVCQLLINHGAELNIATQAYFPLVATPLELAAYFLHQDESYEAIFQLLFFSSMPSFDEE